jgi:hypothetical protein
MQSRQLGTASGVLSIAGINRARLVGHVLSGLAVLFLAMDGVMKLASPAPVVDSFIELGYPESMAVGIGLLELACVAVFLIPRSSFIGALLLTGYLGGAVATHVRVESPLSSIVFPVVLGLLVWAGLSLRDDRLRTLVSSAPKGRS